MALPKFLSNPIFGIIGVVLSAAGLIFAFYVFHNSREYREIVYAVPSDRSILIDSSNATDFEIKYKGIEISTDVTAINITIWNDGKESIRPENILKPLAISLSNSTPILEAKIIKSTREIINFSIDDSEKGGGILFPKWDILEHEDGAVIQIIYAGPASIDISVEGIIEGKKAIRKFEITTEMPRHISVIRWIALIIISIILIFKLSSYTLIKESYSGRWRMEIFMVINYIVMFLFYLFLPLIKLNPKLPIHF